MNTTATEFLLKANREFHNIYTQNYNVEDASNALINKLEEIVGNNENFILPWSGQKAEEMFGRKLSGKNIKFTELLDVIKNNNELQISPITFWCLFFGYNGKDSRNQQDEVFSKLVKVLNKSTDTNIVRSLKDIPGSKVCEGWIQLMSQFTSEVIKSSWDLFDLLMQDNFNKDKINENIAKIRTVYRLGPKAVPNVLHFIRPDLKFAFDNNGNITGFTKTEEMNMEETIKLLENSKQIILTGAPGTGKTYLAKQIAYALTGDNAESSPHIDFCQFHPSFDYTDFVEGLRPVDKGNGDIGFERKDGIFKAFCKKALSKLVSNYDEAYDKFIDYLSENHSKENPLELKTPSNASFRVFLNGKGNLSLQTGQKNEVQGSLTREKIKTFLSENPYEYWAGYYLGVIAYLQKNFNLTSVVDSSEQKYVFIIDEINRGDISKIFGELFFAIDPGYRGEKGRVKTQYHNLVKNTDDLYKDGFYIPENVYIIGTMNDIDRSVESMDFAIRRRFTWKEIKAEDRTSMWDGQIDSLKDEDGKNCKVEAGKKMEALNNEISNTESLSDAFHIGPAYFLKLKEHEGNFSKLWKLHIMPLLKEYLRGTVDPENDLKRFKAAYDLKKQTDNESASTASEE